MISYFCIIVGYDNYFIEIQRPSGASPIPRTGCSDPSTPRIEAYVSVDRRPQSTLKTPLSLTGPSSSGIIERVVYEPLLSIFCALVEVLRGLGFTCSFYGLLAMFRPAQGSVSMATSARPVNRQGGPASKNKRPVSVTTKRSSRLCGSGDACVVSPD